MQRGIASLVAALAVLLGLLQPAESASAPSAVVAYAYAYDGHLDADAWTPTTTQRGPPEAYDRAISYNAVDASSRGTSVRLDPEAGIARTHLLRLVLAAPATATTRVPTQVADKGLAVRDRGRVAAEGVDGFVDLTTAKRRNHILNGDKRGGGHRAEFPSGWSDDRIMHEISDIATAPGVSWRAGKFEGQRIYMRGGIEVLTDANGNIISAWVP